MACKSTSLHLILEHFSFCTIVSVYWYMLNLSVVHLCIIMILPHLKNHPVCSVKYTDFTEGISLFLTHEEGEYYSKLYPMVGFSSGDLRSIIVLIKNYGVNLLLILLPGAATLSQSGSTSYTGQMLHGHIHEYGHVRNGWNGHRMLIMIEHRNLGIRKHVTTSCSGTKPFY